MHVLRDGDTPPDIEGFGDQDSLQGYVSPYVDDEGAIDIDENQAVYLFEMGTETTGPSADYQDVVVLVSLQTESETVGTYTRDSGEEVLICPQD